MEGGVHTKEMKCSKCKRRVFQSMDLETGGFPKMEKCPYCKGVGTLAALRFFMRSL